MANNDALAQILRAVRLTGSVHFCVYAEGNWASDASDMMECFGLTAGRAVPFHIVAEGPCWFEVAGKRHQMDTDSVIAFPSAAPHIAGGGNGRGEIDPLEHLPPPPWNDVPIVRTSSESIDARIHCGFFSCTGFSFPPLAKALPPVLIGRPSDDATSWLKATVRQIDNSITTGNAQGALIERLCETIFLQMLSQQIEASPDKGWLAGTADPIVGRALAAFHDSPGHAWTVAELASASNASRSVLSERFTSLMGTSPLGYVRAWRLHIAALALAETDQQIAQISYEAGYGSEAAFSRAFSKHYGCPPGAWRDRSPVSKLHS